MLCALAAVSIADNILKTVPNLCIPCFELTQLKYNLNDISYKYYLHFH